jgi:hypothetical protein
MEERNAYSFGREPKRCRSLGRPWRLWEDNIRINLKKQNGMPWNGLICLRIGTSGRVITNMVINRRVPQNMEFTNLRVAFTVFITEPNGY